MPTIQDTLETILKLTGGPQYEQGLKQVTGMLETLALAEGAATSALAGFGSRLLASVATLATAGRSLQFVNESFREFAEADAISRRVGFALRQIGSSVPLQQFEELSQRLSDVTGLDDELILQQAEILSRFRLTGQQIQQLIPGVVDVAARTGKSLDQVSQAIGQAFNGRVRGLQLLGIQFKRTGNDVQDFIQLLRRLEAFQGAGAALGQTPAGALEAQRTAFGNLREAVGQRLAPTVQGTVEGFNQVLRDTTRSVESGRLGRFLDFLQTPFREAAESGAAARRGQTAAGRAFRRFFPPPGNDAATEAALSGGGSSGRVERAIQETAANTRDMRNALLRGGSPAAQGAVSIRELNQALGGAR